MSSRKSSVLERQMLVLGFTLLFTVSLVMIIFERVQRDEQAALPPSGPAARPQAVAGEEFIRDQALASYRSQARTVAIMLFANIARLEQGQSVNPDELALARRTILGMVVPAAYQRLHFELLKILNNLQSSPAVDLDYLGERRSRLQEEFPWL